MAAYFGILSCIFALLELASQCKFPAFATHSKTIGLQLIQGIWIFISIAMQLSLEEKGVGERKQVNASDGHDWLLHLQF